MRTCTNPRCEDELSERDPMAAIGFCPSCRMALLFGFQAGGAVAVAMGVLGAVIAWMVR